MTTVVAGADGCRGGWICVIRFLGAPERDKAFLARSINDIISHSDAPEVIALDIPIGLPERSRAGGRDCDVAVRVNLGKRSLAVFAVPARATIAETDYRRACAVAKSNSEPPRQISQQMFHLFPKIREVDIVMTAALQNRIYECHPEAAFWAMNKQTSLPEPKKMRNRMHVPGLELRRELLIEHGFSESFVRSAKFPRKDAAPDDFLDACACAWTAARIFRGDAIRFPPRAPLDAKGLRMEILA